MKMCILICTALLVVSCAPRIHYLGESLPPKQNVDVYYDSGDISKAYKVIGQLTGENSAGYVSLDDIRDEMIKSARLRGADAILFLAHNSFEKDHVVHSKLLTYQEKQ